MDTAVPGGLGGKEGCATKPGGSGTAGLTLGSNSAARAGSVQTSGTTLRLKLADRSG